MRIEICDQQSEKSTYRMGESICEPYIYLIRGQYPEYIKELIELNNSNKITQFKSGQRT